MNENRRVKISVGASSMLMIFIVLSLLTFAVLSYVSAKNDIALTNKALKHTQIFYELNAKTTEKIISIREDFEKAKLSSDCQVLDKGDVYEASFSVVDVDKRMDTTVLIPKDTSAKMRILKQKLVSLYTYQEDSENIEIAPVPVSE